jgi:hypothetical protein
MPFLTYHSMQVEKFSLVLIDRLQINLVLTTEMIEENAQQNPERHMLHNFAHQQQKVRA